MGKTESKRKKLRETIKKKELIFAPGCDSPSFARIIEKAGFDCIYMSGGATSRRFGMTDVGLISLTQMAMNVRDISKVTNIPLIVDMDTGFGSALNVIQSVKEYELAGASGFHIEDQAMPKRCGFAKGKALISKEEMILKIKACVEARDDPNLLIIARSDARGRVGDPEDLRRELYERANAYLKAGADVIFPERPESLEDMKRDIREINGPVLLNGLRFGVSIEDVAKMGFAIAISPGATSGPAVEATWKAMSELKRTGKTPKKITIDLEKPELNYMELIGLSQTREWEEKFLPPEELIRRFGTKEVPRTF